MKIEHPNGYLQYEIGTDRLGNPEIVIEDIKVTVPRKGTGSKLIQMLKSIAFEYEYPVYAYAEPQDDTIDEEGLKAFYEKNGFVLAPEDIDYKLYIWEWNG